jgi:hypothetical protein
MQGREDAQVRISEQPAFRLPTRGSGGAHNGPEVFAAGHGTKMLSTDPRQAGNLVFGEHFLSGFNNDHFFCGPFFLSSSAVLLCQFIYNLRSCRHVSASSEIDYTYSLFSEQ